ncbi:MAG: hypothetical protein PVI59_08020 [Anaerolineae bacterium]|jgi:hypothetical protein
MSDGVFDLIMDPDYEALDLPPVVSKTLDVIHSILITPIMFSIAAVGMLILIIVFTFVMSLVSPGTGVLTPADWGRPFWEVVWLAIKWPYIAGAAIQVIAAISRLVRAISKK